MRDIVTLPSFNAVAAGQTATINLPTSYTYHSIRLRLLTGSTPAPADAAAIKAAITAVRIKIDGKVQRRFSAGELITLNAFRGIAFQAGFLPVYFSEPWRRSTQGEDQLAWGTQDVSTFEIEVDIASGVENPILDARAEVELANRPLGAIVKWRRYVVPVTAAGVVNLTTLPKLDAYYSLHAFSDKVLDVEVRVDQRERWKLTKAEADAFYKDHAFTPQSGHFPIVFDYTRRVADALPMRTPAGNVNDFRIDYNMSAAESFNLLTETLGVRD